jgi:hypothetical protein
LADQAGNVALYAAATGTRIRILPTPGEDDLLSWVLLDGERFYRGTRQSVSAMDLSGRRLWTIQLRGSIERAALAEGRLYLTSDEPLVRAIDAATGDVLWIHGADRIAFGKTRGELRLVFGYGGLGAAVFAPEGPGPMRSIAVEGRVTIDRRGPSPPILSMVTIDVAGVAVRPGSDGRYRAEVRIAGGRLPLRTSACSPPGAAIYLPIDGRDRYTRDLVVGGNCLD